MPLKVMQVNNTANYVGGGHCDPKKVRQTLTQRCSRRVERPSTPLHSMVAGCFYAPGPSLAEMEARRKLGALASNQSLRPIAKAEDFRLLGKKLLKAGLLLQAEEAARLAEKCLKRAGNPTKETPVLGEYREKLELLVAALRKAKAASLGYGPLEDRELHL